MRNTLVALAVALCTACTPTGPGSTSSGTAPARGRLGAFTSSGALNITLDAEAAPLTLAATVSVEGAQFSAPATLGAAAVQHDLFRQNATSATQLRLSVADTRGLRLQRTGVVFRIPLSGAATRVVVTGVSAGDGSGQAMAVDGFDGVPEAR